MFLFFKENFAQIIFVLILFIILAYVTNITSIPDSVILFQDDEFSLETIAGIEVKEEKDTEIIMKASSNINNIYVQEKILHIDKKTQNPTQMEIKDNQQKTTIYILYNEVKVNSTK